MFSLTGTDTIIPIIAENFDSAVDRLISVIDSDLEEMKPGCTMNMVLEEKVLVKDYNYVPKLAASIVSGKSLTVNNALNIYWWDHVQLFISTREEKELNQEFTVKVNQNYLTSLTR